MNSDSNKIKLGREDVSVLVTVFVLCLLALMAPVASSQSSDDLFRDALKAEDKGELLRAIGLYTLLVQRFPDSVEVRANYGEALARAGRYEEAIVQYQEGLKRDPNNSLIRLNLALAYYKEGDFSAAVKRLEPLFTEQPKNRQILLLLADSYLRLGRNADAATALKPAYLLRPEDRAVDYALGTALIRDGKLDEGERVLDRILKDGDSPESTILLGGAQLAARDYIKAAVTLEKVCSGTVNYPGACSVYGRALLKSEDITGSESAFRRALQADSNDFEANLYLGVILRRKGDNQDARSYLEHAKLLRPASPQARFQIAALDAAEGKMEQARKEFETLANEWPDFVAVHSQLAVLYARMNRKADSVREQDLVRKLSTGEHPTDVEPEQ